jgi:hypothetical protein
VGNKKIDLKELEKECMSSVSVSNNNKNSGKKKT